MSSATAWSLKQDLVGLSALIPGIEQAVQATAVAKQRLQEATTSYVTAGVLLNELEARCPDPQAALKDWQDYQVLKAYAEGALLQRRQKMVEYSELQAALQIGLKGQAFFLAFMEKVTYEHVSQLESTLNEIFQYVFDNPMKTVKLTMNESYGKMVMQLSMQVTAASRVGEESLDDSGYSVSLVLGTVTLMYFIMLNNLERIIFFDETFTGLSDRSMDKFLQILHQFIDRHGFKFLLISHEARVLPWATQVYYADAGNIKLVPDRTLSAEKLD
jgi:hypothetical protein